MKVDVIVVGGGVCRRFCCHCRSSARGKGYALRAPRHARRNGLVRACPFHLRALSIKENGERSFAANKFRISNGVCAKTFENRLCTRAGSSRLIGYPLASTCWLCVFSRSSGSCGGGIGGVSSFGISGNRDGWPKKNWGPPDSLPWKNPKSRSGNLHRYHW